MKWEMEVEEIEAVLEKIWDLHDKLSDAIHSISRAHFLSSIRSHNRKSNDDAASFQFHPRKKTTPDASSANGDHNSDNNRTTGFVYIKDYNLGMGVDADDAAALQEAKSLNAIRTALENLEDQLEFFHTVQAHQRAERDAALARLEQSRVVLAMRLAEHQGKKYKVIEEARALVGDVCNASCFVSPENTPVASPTGEKFASPKGDRSNAFVKVFLSGFRFVKKSLKLDQVGGILGNAALVAMSMLALMHLHQVGLKDKYIMEFPQRQEDLYNRNMTKVSRQEGSRSGRSTQLDVLLARG
ncbi:plastid division protein PDV1 [Coffea eugenioides]|uniref:Plastid division protein PDV1-like n=1 Tax=Coffea arabica TaxID=13443 RepID=A0A6P6W425_COFAR|nr:plastid division protein PDV1-like [Coffea arabica]XP_027161018.1 plastid division protein PDV1 [Coffea eugenioides]